MVSPLVTPYYSYNLYICNILCSSQARIQSKDLWGGGHNFLLMQNYNIGITV